MMFILEFANSSILEGEPEPCEACQSNYSHWSEGATVEECMAEAAKQNAEWLAEGSPQLDFRIISVLVKVSP